MCFYIWILQIKKKNHNMFSLVKYLIFSCQTIENNKIHTLESVTAVFTNINEEVPRYC